jgi:hypothetical protein
MRMSAGLYIAIRTVVMLVKLWVAVVSGVREEDIDVEGVVLHARAKMTTWTAAYSRPDSVRMTEIFATLNLVRLGDVNPERPYVA